MCLAASSVFLSAASSLVSYAGAVQKANAQNAYYAENAKAANPAAANQYAALGHQQVQERNAASQEQFENQVNGSRARGTAITSAGEAGVAGLSVNALIGDLFAQEGRQRNAVDAQYRQVSDSIRAQMDQVEAKARGRINSVQRAAPVNLLPYLIQAASGKAAKSTTSTSGQPRSGNSPYDPSSLYRSPDSNSSIW